MNKKIIYTLITAIFLVSACSPAIATHVTMVETPKDDMMTTPTDTMMDKPTDDGMGTPTEAMDKMSTEVMTEDSMMSPAWFDVSLTDVNSDEEFKISDFAGKVVLVENLAMWCSNCKKQQEQVKILHGLLGTPSDLISIGFDVDPNEIASDLKRYTDSNGFDWIYSVPPQEVINEISSLYGAQFLNPPSTPILIIDRQGNVHPMPFGIKSAEDLQTFIEPFLSEGM